MSDTTAVLIWLIQSFNVIILIARDFMCSIFLLFVVVFVFSVDLLYVLDFTESS